MTKPGSAWSAQTIRDLLTVERLSSYIATSNGDIGRAIELYEWNLTVSAAVMQTTAMVEVIVRNAMDKELVAWSTARGAATWLTAAPVNSHAQADIAKAMTRAAQRGQKLKHGKVIAELSFGFWRYLILQSYHTRLWVPALHRAFPGGDPNLRTRRREVESRLDRLLRTRNRAAHHEPIHARNFADDLTAAIEVATWVHPEAGAWVAYTSMLPVAIAAKP